MFEMLGVSLQWDDGVYTPPQLQPPKTTPESKLASEN